ncbi:MAG: isochorismatase family protein, partial [Synergistaceae bacterium]|nr:isochorismatase family protein [Synergistaceae bacterium]
MYKSITADSSFLLMVDIQERLIQAMFNKDEIIKNSIRILTAAKEFSLPLMVSEQYPQGIGSTIPELKNLLPQDINMIN